MKILVGISKAPDTTTKIKFTNDNKEFDESGVQYIVNPYDEWYALVRGIEVKEAQGGSVTTITVGKEDVDPIIRKALAVGADDAVRIDSEPKDAYNVASLIANYAKENDYDMVLLGKETINYNGSQVGGMVAEIMDLPYISNASKMDLDGNKATIVRDIQGGKETLEVETPFVLSAAKGMAEQRIPNMRGIMAARSKKLEVVEPVDAEELTEVVSYALPPEKGDVKLVDPENVEELVELLHKEAKVI
jgi:electron transfer flavoprotein beta subunit